MPHTHRFLLALGAIALLTARASAQYPPKSMPDPCTQPAVAAARRGATAAGGASDLARFNAIVRCAAVDPATAAQAWSFLRPQRDTTVLLMSALFWRHLDAGVLDAAMNAFVIASANARVIELDTFPAGADCRLAAYSELGFILGKPLPQDAQKSVRDRAKAIADDHSEPSRVRSAAACVAAHLVGTEQSGSHAGSIQSAPRPRAWPRACSPWNSVDHLSGRMPPMRPTCSIA